MFDTLRADFHRYYSHFRLLPPHAGWMSRVKCFLTSHGMWAVTDYRFRRWVLQSPRAVRVLLRWPAALLNLVVLTLTGISLDSAARIGAGLFVPHFTGIFVNSDVVLGKGCTISQGVTIGVGGRGNGAEAATGGDRIYFGAGAKVIGAVTIGSDVSIGANAVVVHSVPDGATVVGVPARVVRIGGVRPLKLDGVRPLKLGNTSRHGV